MALTGLSVVLGLGEAGCVGPWRQALREEEVTERAMLYLGHEPTVAVSEPDGGARQLTAGAQARCRAAEWGRVRLVERRTITPESAAMATAYAVLGVGTIVGGAFLLQEDDDEYQTAGTVVVGIGGVFLGTVSLMGLVAAATDKERRRLTRERFGRWSQEPGSCQAAPQVEREPGFLGAGLSTAAGGRVMVAEVRPGFPAAGRLIPGDRFLSFEGRPVEDLATLEAAILRAGAGSQVRLTVERAGKEVEVALRLSADPERVRAAALAGLDGAPDTILRALELDSGVGLDPETRAYVAERIAEVTSGAEPSAFTRLSRAAIGEEALTPSWSAEVPPLLPAKHLSATIRPTLSRSGGPRLPLQLAEGQAVFGEAELQALATWLRECDTPRHGAEIDVTLRAQPSTILPLEAPPPWAPELLTMPLESLRLGSQPPIVRSARLSRLPEPALVGSEDSEAARAARKCVEKAWSACLGGAVDRCEQALRYAHTPEAVEALERAQYHAQVDRCEGNPNAGRLPEGSACRWLAERAEDPDEAARLRIQGSRAEEVRAAQEAEQRRREAERQRREAEQARLEAEAKRAREQAEQAAQRAHQAEVQRRYEAMRREGARQRSASNGDVANAIIRGIQSTTNTYVQQRQAQMAVERQIAEARAATKRRQEQQTRAARAQREAVAQQRQREQLAQKLEQAAVVHRQHADLAADARSRQIAERRLSVATQTAAALRAGRLPPAAASDPGLNAPVRIRAEGPKTVPMPTFAPPTHLLNVGIPNSDAGLARRQAPAPLRGGYATPGVTAALCPTGYEPVPGFDWGAKCAVGPCGCRRVAARPAGPDTEGAGGKQRGVTGGAPEQPPADPRPALGPHFGQPAPSASEPRSEDGPPLGPGADANGCWDGLHSDGSPCVTLKVRDTPGHFYGDKGFVVHNRCARRVVFVLGMERANHTWEVEQHGVAGGSRWSTGVKGTGQFRLGWIGAERASEDWVCIGRAKKHGQGNL